MLVHKKMCLKNVIYSTTEIFEINKINKTSLITYQLQNYTVMDVLALNKYIRNYYTRLTITKTNI